MTAHKGPGSRKLGRRREGPEAVRMVLFAHALTLPAEALTLKTLAEVAHVSFRMPNHIFGSRLGLLAAVAERGYVDLIEELGQAIRSAPPKGQLLAAALAYLAFGLREGGMWQKLHLPELWGAIHTGDPKVRRLASSGTWAQDRHGPMKGYHPFRAVQELRRLAFGIFEGAADTSGCHTPSEAAHATTCLIDGILWQAHYERVNAELSPQARAHAFGGLVEGTVAAWQAAR